MSTEKEKKIGRKKSYQFGDVTRSLWNKVTGHQNGEDSKEDEEDDGVGRHKQSKELNALFSVRKTIKRIRKGSKDKVKVRTVNTNTGQIVESVDTSDSRGWKCNEFTFYLIGATLSKGGIKRNSPGNVRKCFVQFELAEKWYNRTLPDGSTVRWGHRGDVQKSKVISLCSDLCFLRSDMLEDVTFRFKTRTSNPEIVVSLCEITTNMVVKVLGQITISAHELILRDLEQTVPNDHHIRNVSATELFPLKAPKGDENVGFLRMRASYTEKWGALCINMEPHFLPFEESESGVSTEIKRFQANITRIGIAMHGINRFMKTLNDLFGWWDVGKTLVIVLVGLFILWVVPESYSFCIFPWLLVWHILYQRFLRRKYRGTHEYEKNLLQFDVANHADANIRLSVVAAHGLPLTDHAKNDASELKHASMSVVPENPDDELSMIWCKALQRAAKIEFDSEALIEDARKIIKEFDDEGKTLDYWKMKTLLEEKYGEELYKACKSRVQAIKLQGDTSRTVGRWISIRASSKYRSIFASRPKWHRVWCVVNDGQMSWSEDREEDMSKHSFKCELLNLRLLTKKDETDVAFVVESAQGAKIPWRYWIRLRSASECRTFFGRIREEKITAEAVAKQAKYLDIRTIKKIESSLLTGEFYKMGHTRWKKRKMTLSDATLVYQGASWWGTKMKVVPTGNILRVDIKDPHSQTPIGLPLTKYDDYYSSKKSILHFVKNEEGRQDPDQSTDLIFWFESDKTAMMWKTKMDKIIEEIQGGGFEKEDEDEDEDNDEFEFDDNNTDVVKKKKKTHRSSIGINKNLSDPELATQLIDDFSQGRLGFLEGDLNNDYAKVLIAGVFCWYMDATFVRHSTRIFFYPSSQPTTVLNSKDTFHGPDFVCHMRFLNRKIRDKQFETLQHFLVSHHLMVHVIGPASLLSKDSYWRFNNRRARTLGKFINTRFEIEHYNNRCNPDVFVSVHLEENKRNDENGMLDVNTRYIGRTNTEYMSTSPVFGTNGNKPLADSTIDKFLAFARKSRNRLFRVHRDLELLKWQNKLEGVGVRQWYWAFEFTTPRPTQGTHAVLGNEIVHSRGSLLHKAGDVRDRFKSRIHSFARGKAFTREESHFSSNDLGDIIGDDIDKDLEELPVLQLANVKFDSSPDTIQSKSPTTPFRIGMYPDDVEEAVDAEAKRIGECPTLPPEPLKRKEHGVLLPWTQCTDHLVFKIWDEDFSLAEGFGDEKIGICRVPLLDFIPHPTSEGAKARQPEIWKWLPVELSEKHKESQRRLGRSTGKGEAWILVRCQIILRQGDKDVNFDDSKSGYLYLYNRTISVIKYINDFLEEAVVFYEKFKNLLNWTHPRKTQATLIIMVIFSIIMMYLPLKLLFVGAFMFPFTGIFRPPGGMMWMSEHVISSIPDDVTRRKILEKKAPLRLVSLPRATHLPGVILSAYVQHAMSKCGENSVPEDNEWDLHFLALTPDGWVFWWDSHEKGLNAITKACARSHTDEPTKPRRMTSYTRFWGGSERRRHKHTRSRSQTTLEFEDQSPIVQAKAWRALSKCVGLTNYSTDRISREAAELIDGSFHVKASNFVCRKRREHGEWHTITFKSHGTSSSSENMWIAFRSEHEANRWRNAFNLFANESTSLS